MGAGDSRPLFSRCQQQRPLTSNAFRPNITPPPPTLSEIWTKICDTAPLPPLPSFFDPLLLPSPDAQFTSSPLLAQQLQHTALQLLYRHACVICT
jgi:hypothetical protein